MDLYKFLTPDGLRIQPENTPASVSLPLLSMTLIDFRPT